MAEPITNVLGVVGMKTRGEYNPETTYEKLNVVTYNGSSYCAKTDTQGNLPTNTNYWDLIAEKGEKGDTGYTPVKGTDYYTQADKEELEANLSSDVTTEVTTQVGDLVSATPLVASSTADMTDTTRIYVNTTDGHWYWYNGTAWTDGGVYQASEDSTTVQQIDMLTSQSENLVNPVTCKNNTGLTDADGSEAVNNNSWVSDFSLIPELTALTSNYSCRKIIIYDENKNYIGKVSNRSTIDLSDSIYENAVYFRVMINKSTIEWDNRFDFGVINEAKTAHEVLPYKVYGELSYKKGSISLANLSDGIQQSLFLNNILMNKNPLTFEDFSYFTIAVSGEDKGNPTAFYEKELIGTNKAFFIPKGIRIYLSNQNYQFYLYEYDENDNFIRRVGVSPYVLKDFTIEHDGFYRLTARNVAGEQMTDVESKTLVSYIRFENKNFVNYQNYIGYIGEKINLNKLSGSYKRVNFNTLYQDSCQYNGKAFVFNHLGEFKVVDIETETEYTGFHLDQYETIVPHANCVCFSNEKYDNNDPFPLLYINAYNTADLPKGTCFVHRIFEDNNVYTTALIQTINIGFINDELWTVSGDVRNYGNFLVNTDKNQLIVYTLRNKKTRFFIFNLPSINNSNVTLNISDIIDYFDCTFFEYIQGGHYQNGKVYSLDGISGLSGTSYLHVFDLEARSLTSEVDLLSLMSEPESIFEYNDELYIGSSAFYKFKF